VLSDREQRELALIEEELSSDRHLVALLERRRRRRWLRRVVNPRAAVVFGVLVILAALVLNLDLTFVQGLLVAGAGVVWWSWEGWASEQARAPGRRRT